MDQLQNLVEEAQKKTQQHPAKKTNNKYLRRAEVERLAERSAKKAKTKSQKKKKRQREEMETSSSSGRGEKKKQQGSQSREGSGDEFGGGSSDLEEKDQGFLTMPAEEVINRLRALKQPICYFGESDEARQKRLRQLEILEHEQVTSSKGTRNIFQDMASQVEKELLDAAALSGGSKDDFQAHQQAKKQKLHKYDQRRNRDEFDTVEDYILFFFKRILREWEQDLQSGAQKKSTQDKIALATQKQTRQYIRPFFKLLKKREVDADILVSVEKIVKYADKREYMKASDEYLKMSIGNAPWPMGVTMVGIHERSGRAKIFSSQIAHILNDECQRKYIQSMKRLLTWCSQKYPAIVKDK